MIKFLVFLNISRDYQANVNNDLIIISYIRLQNIGNTIVTVN